jgi:hypothetical protein
MLLFCGLLLGVALFQALRGLDESELDVFGGGFRSGLKGGEQEAVNGRGNVGMKRKVSFFYLFIHDINIMYMYLLLCI